MLINFKPDLEDLVDSKEDSEHLEDLVDLDNQPKLDAYNIMNILYLMKIKSE